MKKLDFKTYWCSDSYQVPSLLILELDQNVRQSTMQVNDDVCKWFIALEPEERAAVKFIHLN